MLREGLLDRLDWLLDPRWGQWLMPRLRLVAVELVGVDLRGHPREHLAVLAGWAWPRRAGAVVDEGIGLGGREFVDDLDVEVFVELGKEEAVGGLPEVVEDHGATHLQTGRGRLQSIWT